MQCYIFYNKWVIVHQQESKGSNNLFVPRIDPYEVLKTIEENVLVEVNP